MISVKIKKIFGTHSILPQFLKIIFYFIKFSQSHFVNLKNMIYNVYIVRIPECIKYYIIYVGNKCQLWIHNITWKFYEGYL